MLYDSANAHLRFDFLAFNWIEDANRCPVQVMQMSQKPRHIYLPPFLLTGVAPGQRLLDVGCGEGKLVRELVGRGCSTVGVEIDEQLVKTCQASGLEVVRGRAEQLPFADNTFDGVVCSVVLPYTDERHAVAELSRVLKPGGFVNITCHGFGYGLRCALRGPRIYGMRMLLNTLWYRWSGRKIRGWVGDTLCQSQRSLRRYYASLGLALEREFVVETMLGGPVFLCSRAIKK